MISGNSTKIVKIAMFGKRKKAPMPVSPVALCSALSGASTAAIASLTGRRRMPARLDDWGGTVSVATRMLPVQIALLGGLLDLCRDVLIDAFVGVLDRKSTRLNSS